MVDRVYNADTHIASHVEHTCLMQTDSFTQLFSRCIGTPTMCEALLGPGHTVGDKMVSL